MTPFFLPYQVRWIRDDARIKIMEKSRQIGLSWSTAYRALRNAAVHPRTHIWICSRDLQQAQLFLNDCKAFASVLNQAYQEKLIRRQSEQRTILRLNNGSTLTLISSNINAQAGKRGSRILDEFALHEDPEALYNVAYPGITWGGQLEMISTHRGAHNFFNRLIEETRNGGNPKGISLHRVTLSDALEQGFLRKLKAKLPPDDPRQAMDEGDYYNFIKNSCATEKAFLQEYMCQPMEDASTLLSYEALERCFYDKNCDWRSWTNGTALMGVDLARTQDLSAFVLVEKTEGTFFLRHVQCLKNARFDEQEALFEKLFRNFNVQRVCVDQTGIGRQFLERAQMRFGTAVEGVQFTQSTKETLAYNLKTHIEQRTLRLPCDEKLIADLLAVRISEDMKLTAQHGSDGHADRFWALALALHADRKQASSSAVAELFHFQRPTACF